jgi:hypothetical protein
MEAGDRGWRWPYAAFLTLIATAVVGHDLIANCVSPSETKTIITQGLCAEAWINRYQTLIAGFIALAGAVLTVVAILAQIRQVNDIEQARREHDEIAARAVLPLALSTLHDYVDSCIKVIAAYSDKIDDSMREYMDESCQLPTLPRDVLPSLKDVIKYAPKETAGEISLLLVSLQIQHARLRDGKFRLEGRMLDRDDRIFDCVELLARINRLFPYSRGWERNRNHKFSTEMRNAVSIANISEEEFGRVFWRVVS